MAQQGLLICTACGTQFDRTQGLDLRDCKICDDPRQFVPTSGQSFTTLADLRKGNYENQWVHDPEDSRIWWVRTEPQFAIGERAFLLQTAAGNVLWDLIAYLDQKTIDFINAKGGLKAIVISHPHYWTTHVEWAKTFGCPVYMAKEDEEWICRSDNGIDRRFIQGSTEKILPGVTAIKTGGHFPGSMVLHWAQKLFIADSLVTQPSGLYHVDRLPGTTSFTFMWSIPNMIPLPPSDIQNIWRALKSWDFHETYGAFRGMDIRHEDVKKRVLESMKIQIKAEGHPEHELLNESWP
ncbi:MAG: hypothetical protein M1835_008058 [Candelina submexicana]|nr:MAG: hypothetical protein M1835_008058 [Candelina submexicana]